MKHLQVTSAALKALGFGVGSVNVRWWVTVVGAKVRYLLGVR